MCVLSRLPFFLRNFRGREKGGKGRTRLFRRRPFLAAAAWPSARALKELGNLDHRWEEEKLVEDNNDNNDNKKVAPAPFPLPGSSGFSPALPSRKETKKVSLDCIQWVSNPRLSRDRCFRHPRFNCGASYSIDLKPAAIWLFRRGRGRKSFFFGAKRYENRVSRGRKKRDPWSPRRCRAQRTAEVLTALDHSAIDALCGVMQHDKK